MSTTAISLPRNNPFATRWVRPGAIPFLFQPGEGMSLLLERLETHGWRGQIVGPHGTGKSTLVADLLAELSRRSIQVRRVELHEGEGNKRAEVRQALEEPPAGPGIPVLVVDGFEQLSWWSRHVIKSACRRLGFGLIVTAHRSVGLPDLYRTAMTPSQARQLVDYLLRHEEARCLDLSNLPRFLSARGGNFRDVLFDLYDLYEERRPRV
jgi:hypothetical protein